MEKSEETLPARFERLPGLLTGTPGLVRRGRYLSGRALVGIGDTTFHLTFQDGAIVGFERGASLMRSWCWAVRATPAAWTGYWQAVPDPGWHDLLALTKRGEAWLEGDLQPLIANLQYVKDLLALPRHAASGKA